VQVRQPACFSSCAGTARLHVCVAAGLYRVCTQPARDGWRRGARAGLAARMSTQLQRGSEEEARLRDEEQDYERFMASSLGSLDAADDEQEVAPARRGLG